MAYYAPHLPREAKTTRRRLCPVTPPCLRIFEVLYRPRRTYLTRKLFWANTRHMWQHSQWLIRAQHVLASSRHLHRAANRQRRPPGQSPPGRRITNHTPRPLWTSTWWAHSYKHSTIWSRNGQCAPGSDTLSISGIPTRQPKPDHFVTTNAPSR